MAAVSRAILVTASLATLSLATALALGGCGSDDGTPGRAAPPEPTPSRTPSSSVTPTPRTSGTPSAAPSATPSRDDGRPGGRHHGRHKVGALAPRARTADAAHLLTADLLPTVGGRAWAVDTETADGAVGACQKTDLGTIGAVAAVSRTFTADDGLTAIQVVARFADARSAWRAHQVLAAWRDDCETRVHHAAVGPLEPVPVHAGTADSYRGSFRSRSAGLGILRAGSYLTLLEVTAAGGRYPSSWDPARVAVRRIARTF
jgi:hypothetical protein